MKTLLIMMSLFTSSFAFANGGVNLTFRGSYEACDIQRIHELATGGIEELSRHGGRRQRPDLVRLALNFAEIQRISGSCAQAPQPIPGSPTVGQSCVLDVREGHTDYKSTQHIESARPIRVNNGAVMRIIAYDHIYHQGRALEAFQVELISNPQHGIGTVGSPGQRLWEWRSVILDQCKF